MRKYVFITVVMISWGFNGSSQEGPAFIKDSLDLENSKRIVRQLKGIARVDLMNRIAQRTGYISSHQTRVAISFNYATQALHEATRMGYKNGIANALLELSVTSGDSSMNMPGDSSIKKEYARRARRLAEEVGNPETLGWCYYLIVDTHLGLMNNNDSLIAYWKKSIDYFLRAKDTLHAAEVTNWLPDTYEGMGDYETAFDYAKKAVELSQKSGDDFSISWKEFLIQYSFGHMSGLYSTAGDYETAMRYLKQDKEYAIVHKTGWLRNGDIAWLFCDMGEFDSALVYWNLWRNDPNWNAASPGHKAWGNGIRGKIFMGNKQYDEAIETFGKNVAIYKDSKIKNDYAVAREFGYMANAYYEMGNYETAFQYAQESLALINRGKYNDLMMKSYQLMSLTYHHLGSNDSAYEYLLKYNRLKDSTLNKQFLLRLYNYKKEAEDAKKESQIGLLNRDNRIKQQQLKQEATFRNFMIAGFVAFLFASLYVFRNINLKRKNERLRQEQIEQEWKLRELESENRHIELQKQSAELEMQALRAQMNPHFIFNSLSSINHFILKNESRIASNYLTRFSRLIRMVLINSQKSLITLEDELQMLDLYLEMERLRFKNTFDYSILFLNTIDSDNIFMPPLLLQPFCENAIWHGLMHKEGQGRLDIELSMENNILNCTITDNGIGREKAEEMKSKSAEKEKSMGLRITEDRLNLLNREKGIHTYYNIEDLTDSDGNSSGTKVHLKISYQKSMEVANT